MGIWAVFFFHTVSNILFEPNWGFQSNIGYRFCDRLNHCHRLFAVVQTLETGAVWSNGELPVSRQVLAWWSAGERGTRSQKYRKSFVYGCILSTTQNGKWSQNETDWLSSFLFTNTYYHLLFFRLFWIISHTDYLDVKECSTKLATLYSKVAETVAWFLRSVFGLSLCLYSGNQGPGTLHLKCTGKKLSQIFRESFRHPASRILVQIWWTRSYRLNHAKSN